MGKCMNENREQKEENVSRDFIFKKVNLYQSLNKLARKIMCSCYICTN